MLLGSIFMVIVDTFARSISPNEIPLSIITGIIGTPLLSMLFIIEERNYNEQNFNR